MDTTTFYVKPGTSAERKDLYQRLHEKNTAPLWEVLAKLVTLGFQKDDILHTAESMFHDHGPANRHGLASCWIYRRHDHEGFGATMSPGKLPKYNFRFNSMADLAKAHRENRQ